jgi:hypothetical protein
MAYTPSARKTKSAVNNFAGQAVDGNRVAMGYGNAMVSQDATGTPVVSPVTNMSGSGVTLVIPQNAVRFTINSTVACLVGEDSSFAQGINTVANVPMTFDIAQQATISVKPSSGTNTTSFYFTVV